jgi:O-antigen ligase
MDRIPTGTRLFVWAALLVAEVAAGLSMLIDPELGLLLSVLIPLGLLLCHRPLLGYMLMVFFLPNYGKMSFIHVGGTADITMLQPAIALTMIAWAVHAIRERKLTFSFHSVDLALLLVFAWAALAVVWTVNPFRGLQHLVRVMTGISVYFLSVQLIRDKRDFRLVVGAWLLLALLHSFYGAYELTGSIKAAASYEQVYTEGYEKIHRDVRASGLFDSPDMAGFFFSLAVVLVTTRFATLKNTPWRKLVWFLIPLFIFTLVTTITRKSYLATSVAIVVMCLLSKKMRWGIVSQLVFVVGGVAVIMFTPFGDAIRERVSSMLMPPEEAIPYRYETWQHGIGYWLDSPLIGQGLGSFYELALKAGTVLQMPHNYYIWTLAEMGVVGILLLFNWAYSLFRAFVVYIRDWVEDETYLFALGLLSGLLVIVLHAFFRSFMLVDPTFWGYMGLCRAFLKVYEPTGAEVIVPVRQSYPPRLAEAAWPRLLGRGRAD